MISDRLREQTTRFTKEIQTLLNCTIASHVQIKAVALPVGDDRLFMLGHLMAKDRLTARRFRLKPRAPKAELWMDVSFQLRLDAEREHLMVDKSFFGLFGAEDAKQGLFHYDYERDKADGYPDAHLQVYAESELFATLNDPKADRARSLSKLHFPVGGKRFRPCLEDIIEFLIVERLVEARDGYEKVIETGREGFRKNQLMAAMRRDPATVEAFAERYGITGHARGK
ncbi:hypothetical protein OG864_45205 [Streptomyces sp. NBC_00124]|uniref:hypothetical protein n=1 Tax=Streptomyces sp. NBC_00124 TaxID=2975662 RepID=UPI00224D6D3F|nr:hypothetical protein [Streptomyces sp. NBC_00124]MCX5365901.1 hypothetical protein [Streptomyces sp. NBC_00124]